MSDKVERCKTWLKGNPLVSEVQATLKKFENRLEEIGDEHPETEETIHVIEVLGNHRSEPSPESTSQKSPNLDTSDLGSNGGNSFSKADCSLSYEAGSVKSFSSSEDKLSAFEVLKKSLGTTEIVTNRKTFGEPESEEVA